MIDHMKGFTIATTIFFLVFSAQAQVLSVKEQAVTINEVLTDRIDNLLPKLMDEAKIDCWLIISREYNEDPILKTFLPAEWLSARRTTMLVFYRDKKNESIHSYAIARYQVGKRIQAAWNPEKEPNQWKALSKLIDSLNPNQIALNTSKDYGHADGLHYTEFNELNNAMSPNLLKKIVSAEKLGVAWLETRTEKEMTFYPTLLAISHQIIKEGFSNKVIQPNKTTTNDLVWWFRQKVSDLGLSTWFHPSVEIQRRESNEKDAIIRRKTNRLQDILTSNFKTSRTGNEILAASLNQAKAEGIQPSIYTHPIGFHGHAAGTTIGMWDMQQGVPGSGDYAMRPNTCYSIELNATHTIVGWNRPVRIALEQNGCYNGSSFDYLDGRQKTILLIQ